MKRTATPTWIVVERDGRFYASPAGDVGELEVVRDGHGAWLHASLGFFVCSE